MNDGFKTRHIGRNKAIQKHLTKQCLQYLQSATLYYRATFIELKPHPQLFNVIIFSISRTRLPGSIGQVLLKWQGTPIPGCLWKEITSGPRRVSTWNARYQLLGAWPSPCKIANKRRKIYKLNIGEWKKRTNQLTVITRSKFSLTVTLKKLLRKYFEEELLFWKIAIDI